MNENDLNLIYKSISGSRLYGTSIDDSDVDIRGVCFEPMECIIGLGNFEQYIQNSNGKDITIYGLKKFVKLALENNPNILELLFSPDTGDTCLFTSSDWIRHLRKDFLSKKIATKFYGYITSELSKISGIHRNLENNKRKELFDKHGYDTKAASHVIRLAYEGIKLLEDGEIIFPLRIADVLKKIKLGYFSTSEYNGILNSYLEMFRKAEENTKLPTNPNYQKIQNYIMELYRCHIVAYYD